MFKVDFLELFLVNFLSCLKMSHNPGPVSSSQESFNVFFSLECESAEHFALFLVF